MKMTTTKSKNGNFTFTVEQTRGIDADDVAKEGKLL